MTTTVTYSCSRPNRCWLRGSPSARSSSSEVEVTGGQPSDSETDRHPCSGEVDLRQPFAQSSYRQHLSPRLSGVDGWRSSHASRTFDRRFSRSACRAHRPDSTRAAKSNRSGARVLRGQQRQRESDVPDVGILASAAWRDRCHRGNGACLAAGGALPGTRPLTDPMCPLWTRIRVYFGLWTPRRRGSTSHNGSELANMSMEPSSEVVPKTAPS